ncbi:hypothetical protein P4120_30625 [Bacillus thuringiensis]|nr:hypothetical protein [Bacillus thuringiensis]
MAVKMKEAFSKVINDNVTARDLDDPVNEYLKRDLKCKECPRTVFHRRTHNRAGSEIPALFYLEAGALHEEYCSYNTLGQVKKIARESDDDILGSIDKKNFVFRLNLIHKPLKEVNDLDKQLSMKNIEGSSNKDIRYQSRGKLNSYLATMQKIIRLRNTLEEQNELAQHIEIDMYGQRIRWSDFYYESERYMQAYKYLDKMNWKNRHPICIEGVVDSVKYMPKSGKYAINLVRKKEKNNTSGSLKFVSPSIYFDAKQLSPESIQKGQQIVICALCKNNSREIEKTEYLNIGAPLYNQHQIVIF